MNADQMVAMLQEFLYLGLLLVAPTVITSMAVGLIIAIFQTITSIQEQTLTFAPRIVAVAIVLALTLAWSLNLLMDFTIRIFSQMQNIQA